MASSRLPEKGCLDSDVEYETPSPGRIENDHCQRQCNSRSLRQHRGVWFTCIFAILFAYFMASVPFLFFILNTTATTSDDHTYAIPYSPASGVVRYTIKESAPLGPNDFVGPPSDISRKAWLDLVRPTLIRISHKEMMMAQEDPEHSVRVEEGGYMGSLGVYHELHCLRRLKLYLYKEHYYPEIDSKPAEKEYEVKHLDHCVDTIRQSLMCAGNTALYTFQWERNGTGKPRTKTNSKRRCVDFEALRTWNLDRGIGFSPALVGPEWND